MINICRNYCCKLQLDINIVDFIYGGEKVNFESTFSQQIKEKDQMSNKMIIQVVQKSDIKPTNLVCPICQEIINIGIKDYKINLFGCKNGHKIDNISLNEYEKTQDIDISKIKCEIKDDDYNKGNTFENTFYRCNTCKKNLCPICKSNHNKGDYLGHKIINYENKNYICEIHNIPFIQYCQGCKTNLCIFCGKEHKDHSVIGFQDILSSKEDHKKEINELKENIDKLNKEINDIIEKFSTFKNNLKKYYDIYNYYINNYNCENINNELLYNINEFKNFSNIIKNDLDKIIKDDNLNNKFNGIIKIYEKMINKNNTFEFVKDPLNLKYKLDITDKNDHCGANDIFEVFTSYKDKKVYIASKNVDYNIDIISLSDNQKIKSLNGHNNSISTIRYFINNKDYNEYLISADHNYLVIIWDITNNYNIKYKIETEYDDIIYSCLLVFPENNDDNFIITSSISTSDEDEQSLVKAYSLNNGEFIKFINNNEIYYLLSWHNKNNNKYYIVQLSNRKIIINNLIEDELYYELKNKPEDIHNSGFIFSKDNKDYLCSSSTNGYIHIWDLYNKNIFKVINTNNCYLMHIIQWNSKYIIVADYDNKCFKIINLENENIADIGQQHTKEVVCIKKIHDDKYGELLLSASNDKSIKLWNI